MSGLISLRPYQLDGIDRVRQRIAAGCARVLFVLATGGGKTVLASHLVASALERGSRTLFVAHRIELIKQSFAKLVRNGIPIAEIGIVMGDTPVAKAGELFPVELGALTDDELWTRFARRRTAARVQIGSIDTLRVRAKFDPFDLIIIDEAHRALSPSYVALVATYPEAVVVGLTATPYRADGKGLDELFDDLVVIATPKLLIAEGFLVEPEVWTVPVGQRPDLSGVKMKGRDYDPAQLSAAVDRAELVGDIVEHWLRHAAGVRTVAFACGVEHSKRIAERFCAAGVPAEHLDGETPTPVRAAILARLERGETLVVSNCGVLCEGWDQPSVKCAILARPTKSTGLVMQQAGRILRPWKNQKAIILDHAGCMLEHGLPQDDREFTLKGDSKKAKNAGARARECPECNYVVPLGTPQCPSCGYVFQPSDAGAAELVEVAGQLVRADASQDERDRVLYGAIVAEWNKKNSRRDVPLKPGWCFHRFREKAHGRRPPKGCELPKLGADLEEKLRISLELKATAAAKGYAPAYVHVRMKAIAELPRAIAEVAASETKAPGEATEYPPHSVLPPAPSSPRPLDPWERPQKKRPAPAAPKPEVELEEVAF